MPTEEEFLIAQLEAETVKLHKGAKKRYWEFGLQILAFRYRIGEGPFKAAMTAHLESLEPENDYLN